MNPNPLVVLKNFTVPVGIACLRICCGRTMVASSSIRGFFDSASMYRIFDRASMRDAQLKRNAGARARSLRVVIRITLSP